MTILISSNKINQFRCLDCNKTWKYRSTLGGILWIPICWFHSFFLCRMRK